MMVYIMAMMDDINNNNINNNYYRPAVPSDFFLKFSGIHIT